MVRRRSRWPGDKTLAKEPVELNRTLAVSRPARHGHGAGLPISVTGDACFQRRHGTIPPSGSVRGSGARGIGRFGFDGVEIAAVDHVAAMRVLGEYVA